LVTVWWRAGGRHDASGLSVGVGHVTNKREGPVGRPGCRVRGLAYKGQGHSRFVHHCIACMMLSVECITCSRGPHSVHTVRGWVLDSLPPRCDLGYSSWPSPVLMLALGCHNDTGRLGLLVCQIGLHGIDAWGRSSSPHVCASAHMTPPGTQRTPRSTERGVAVLAGQAVTNCGHLWPAVTSTFRPTLASPNQDHHVHVCNTQFFRFMQHCRTPTLGRSVRWALASRQGQLAHDRMSTHQSVWWYT
jgi:hypothetical protein